MNLATLEIFTLWLAPLVGAGAILWAWFSLATSRARPEGPAAALFEAVREGANLYLLQVLLFALIGGGILAAAIVLGSEKAPLPVITGLLAGIISSAGVIYFSLVAITAASSQVLKDKEILAKLFGALQKTGNTLGLLIAGTGLLAVSLCYLFFRPDAELALLTLTGGAGITALFLHFNAGIRPIPPGIGGEESAFQISKLLRLLSNLYLAYLGILALALTKASLAGALFVLLFAALSLILWTAGISFLRLRQMPATLFAPFNTLMLIFIILNVILLALIGSYVIRIDPKLLLPIFIGYLTAFLLSLFLQFSARQENDNLSYTLTSASLTVLLSAAAILLANRLYGAYGVALLSLGMVGATPFLTTLAALRPVVLAAEDQGRTPRAGMLPDLLRAGSGSLLLPFLLITISMVALGRGYLGFYLEETGLNLTGIVITHAYSFASLLLGIVFPLLLAAALAHTYRKTNFAALLGILIIIFPVFAGFFLHLEPLGGFWVGLLLSSLATSIFFLYFKKYLLGEEQGNMVARFISLFISTLSALILPLIITAVMMTPWLLTVVNATRSLRVTVFIGISLLIVILFGVARQWDQ